jgi:hypothetical protein
VAFLSPPTTDAVRGGTQGIREIQGIQDGIDIAGDQDVACVLRRSGRVACILVQARDFEHPVPEVRVAEAPGIGDAAALSALDLDFSVLTRAGKLITFRVSPIQPPREDPLLKDAASVRVGLQFKCALLKSGKVVCSGFNDQGQLGSGDYQSSKVVRREKAQAGDPLFTRWTPVVGLPHAVSIAVGKAHACAAMVDGRVFCWGSNEDQSLGAGRLPFSTEPVEVKGVQVSPPTPKGR